MLNKKTGASIISLALATVAIALTTSALVIATNNSAMYRYEKAQRNQHKVVESVAYKKVYRLDEVKSIARQAYANNYASYYNKQVDLDGFKALVIGEMMEKIPQNQLEDYIINITSYEINVESRY